MKTLGDAPIIAPVDFSDESAEAVAAAIEMAGSPSQVTALHVVKPFVLIDPVSAAVAGISDQARCRDSEKELRDRFAGPQFAGLNFEVRLGDPGSEIVKLAAELKAGVIVMPSHGRSGLAHILMGSVAERVVRTAKCPVLVLR
jgi:nucleotide-binding universal stress UspA family protein